MTVEDILVKVGVDVSELDKLKKGKSTVNEFAKISEDFTRQQKLASQVFSGFSQKIIDNATEINKLGKQYDSFGKALGMPFELWKKFNQQGGEFSSKSARMANSIRMTTHGLRGFKMELLSVMFFGMGVQRFFTGLIQSSLELTGVTELLSYFLGVMFLDAGFMVLDLLIKLWEWFDSLPGPVKEAINYLVLAGIVLGAFLSVTAALILGIGGLILFFSGWQVAIASVIKMLGLLRLATGLILVGIGLKMLWDQAFKKFDLVGDLIAALCAATGLKLLGMRAGLAFTVGTVALAIVLTIQAIHDPAGFGKWVIDTANTVLKGVDFLYDVISKAADKMRAWWNALMSGGKVEKGEIISKGWGTQFYEGQKEEILKLYESGELSRTLQWAWQDQIAQATKLTAPAFGNQLGSQIGISSYFTVGLSESKTQVQGFCSAFTEQMTPVKNITATVSTNIKQIGVNYTQTATNIKSSDSTLSNSFSIVQKGSDSFNGLNQQIADTVDSYKSISDQLGATDFPDTYTQQIDEFKQAIKESNDELKNIPQNWQNAINKINAAKINITSPSLPSAKGTYATGGVIPHTGLYKLHTGETVSQAGDTFNSAPTINVYASAGMNVDELVRKVSAVIVSDLGRLSRG